MEGQVRVMPGVRLGYLEQTAVSGAQSTVKEEVMSRMEEYQTALAEVEIAEAECTEGLPCQLERLESALAAFETAGGYTVQVRASSAWSAWAVWAVWWPALAFFVCRCPSLPLRTPFPLPPPLPRPHCLAPIRNHARYR